MDVRGSGSQTFRRRTEGHQKLGRGRVQLHLELVVEGVLVDLVTLAHHGLPVLKQLGHLRVAVSSSAEVETEWKGGGGGGQQATASG